VDSVVSKLVDPHLEVESDLFAQGFLLVGALDEVGRGSAFGPCCVGLCVIDANVGAHPRGLRDSKLLTPTAREKLVGPIEAWVRDCAVGEASAREIDEFGLTAALRLAGQRALAHLRATPDVVLLDGSHDWLSSPTDLTLLGAPYLDISVPPVRTRVKADLTCASVAAASVLAKVHRDRLICELAIQAPGYDLANNKGYVTPSHVAGLRELGPSEHHRVSWKLPSRAVS
jgi:ribonuclease HII